MIILIGLITVLGTFLGGLFALRFKDKLHLIIGFSAGAVLGIALFDVLPESLNLVARVYRPTTVTLLVAMGFAIFMVVDRLFLVHCRDDEHCQNISHHGNVSATALIIHSFLDGLGIGLAFQVSPAIGWIVAAGVIAHDFSDGINTVNIILRNQGRIRQALWWLAGDALAPIIGILVTLFFSVSEAKLGLILALFCGFFLFIGASDLIPESHHRHPYIWTTISTVLGLAVIYLAVNLAQI